MEKIVANPYQAGGRLRKSEHFVGRESELRQILSRVANMDSVSVVGPRHIGKSSLLHHIVTTGQQRLNESYQFHYLDLQPLCSAEEFYDRACEAIIGEPGSCYDDLEAVIEGKKIVLCLDEFEQTLKADFGDEFFHGLRSLAQTGNLALVIATKATLTQLILRNENPLVSPFFNVFTTVKLGELTEADARALVAKSDCFNREETDFILRLAGTHPHWISFVSARLYDAKQEARAGGAVDFSRIERLFKEERDGAAADSAVATNQAQQNAATERLAAGGSSGAIITSLLLLLAGVLFGKLSINSLDSTAGLLVSGGLILIGLALFLLRGVNWIGGTR